MKFKNLTIILLIFIIPILAYFLLSNSEKGIADKTDNGDKPQIIKFTSLMCLDCKKLGKVMKEVYPDYSDDITLIEIQVQNNDDYTKEMIDTYNINLVPTIIILDEKGKQLNKIEGFIEKKKLEQIMKDLTNE